MGRKRVDVKYNGVPLYANIAGREIRVTRDIKKKQNTINYKLIDSSKPRYIIQSTDLHHVKKHYDKYVADLSFKIDVPSSEITPTNKYEISIKWLQIFEKDEDILKYLFTFYGEQHFLEKEEGEDVIPLEKLADDYNCQAAITFMRLQEVREIVQQQDEDYEPFLCNLNNATKEAYAFYNKTNQQPTIIQCFSQQLNEFNISINDKTKEELQEALWGAGVVTKNNLESGKKYWGENVMVVDSVDDYYRNEIFKATDKGLVVSQRQITPHFIINEFMKLLESEPDTVCKISGVKEFGYLKNITRKKTLTLKQVGEYYFNRHKYTAQKPIETAWRRSMKNWWEEFVSITGAASLDDITLQTINNYQLEIYKVYNDNHYLPAWLAPQSKKLLKETPATKNWVKKRFSCITTIFSNLFKIVEDTTDTSRVLSYLKKLQLPEDTEKFDPEPISRDDFISLFKATDAIRDEKMKVRWRCILLLALNSASYFKDLADIKKEHIDLENQTLIMVRLKKKTLKVAKLWDITIRYIKQLRQLHNNNSDFEFVSNAGSRYSPLSMRNYYRDILKSTTNVTAEFNSLRDGACYAMANSGIRSEIRKMVMGHKTDKIQDRYLKRDGAIVAEAAKAVYEFYDIKTLE